MNIEKIVTLANKKVRLRFLAMERSLRATGCNLPLQVIPYDNDLFDLPKGATWWEMPEITRWLAAENARTVMRKYQCLAIANYQFVDADVCFLTNPQEVLQTYSGFITSCGHWHNLGHTVTKESSGLMAQQTTAWQKNIFNSGQFACDRALFDSASLQKAAMQPDYVGTCLRSPFHEQPGMNLFVFASGCEVTNLTLPPVNMESTWAGDYPGEYERYWTDAKRKPYLIHWAGIAMNVSRPINQIFYDFLTREERAEWDAEVNAWSAAQKKNRASLRTTARRMKNALKTFQQQ